MGSNAGTHRTVPTLLIQMLAAAGRTRSINGGRSREIGSDFKIVTFGHSRRAQNKQKTTSILILTFGTTASGVSDFMHESIYDQ